MTLDLSKFVKDVMATEDSKQSAIESIVATYKRLGFELDDKPNKRQPKLPVAGVSKLKTSEIIELQAEFICWMDYAGEQAALQEYIAKECTEKMDAAIRKVRLKASGTATEKDDKARTHSTVVKLKRVITEAKGVQSLLNNKHHTFSRLAYSCGKELERRGFKATRGFDNDPGPSRPSVSRKLERSKKGVSERRVNWK